MDREWKRGYTTPVILTCSLLPGSDEQQSFVLELEDFIGRLLQLVEVELNFDFTKHGKIREQIHGVCL